MHWRRVSMGLALAAGIVASANAERPFEWNELLERGKTIEIKGVHGSIQARVSSGDRVEVVTTRSGRSIDVATLRFEVIEDDGNFTISAVYPGHGSECRPGSGGRIDTRLKDSSSTEYRFGT